MEKYGFLAPSVGSLGQSRGRHEKGYWPDKGMSWRKPERPCRAGGRRKSG